MAFGSVLSLAEGDTHLGVVNESNGVSSVLFMAPLYARHLYLNLQCVDRTLERNLQEMRAEV